MADQKWKPGDKVKLASGGPVMVVEKVYTRALTTKEVVLCKWFDASGKIHKDDFAPDTLVAATDD